MTPDFANGKTTDFFISNGLLSLKDSHFPLSVSKHANSELTFSWSGPTNPPNIMIFLPTIYPEYWESGVLRPSMADHVYFSTS